MNEPKAIGEKITTEDYVDAIYFAARRVSIDAAALEFLEYVHVIQAKQQCNTETAFASALTSIAYIEGVPLMGSRVNQDIMCDYLNHELFSALEKAAKVLHVQAPANKAAAHPAAPLSLTPG
jgi:hypothetical protein